MLRSATTVWLRNSSRLRSQTSSKLKFIQHASYSMDSTTQSKEEILHALTKYQQEPASKTVDWFLSQMPKSYFRSINEEDRLVHLNAITALAHAQFPEVILRSPDSTVYSYIHGGANYPGQLAKILSQLPLSVDGAQLARLKIFTSLDDTLGLDIFRFGVQVPYTGSTVEEQEARKVIQEEIKKIQDGEYLNNSTYPKPAPYFSPDAVDAYLKKCNSMYVKFSSPRRIAHQIALYEQVRGTEDVVVHVEHGWETKSNENKLSGGLKPQTMLTIAASNVLTKSAVQKAATYLGLCKLNVVRAHLDVVRNGENENGHVALIRILVTPSNSAFESKMVFEWEKIAGNLKYLKWVDDKPLQLVTRVPELGLSRAEIIHAYSNLLHGMLAKKDPFAYALSRIVEVVEHPQHLPAASQIADLFLDKFDPKIREAAGGPMSDEELKNRVVSIKNYIRENVEAEDTIYLLNTMADAVAGTLRTNKFVRDRYALALRLDPSVTGVGTVGSETPFGVFFIYGRRFKGFHVRFRDIARGGLRMVYPSSSEAHGLESAKQYNEAYNLAFAQQLKNKDIPEGGSKAVVLCDPIFGLAGDTAPRDFIIRKSVKAFSDALLDLNTTNKEVKSNIVDYYGDDELIYLGPDENIIPSDIVWMTDRAKTREYPVPRAFISSKPDAGINHKVYGVTSEGVVVFADVALRSQGIDPSKDHFTVKITGGTDGDVAGNVIKILHRNYGDNAVVVGICDGTAVVEDPNGLDMKELLRLVNASLPLSSFNPDRLKDSGRFLLANNTEGIRARNSMHNRVQSDIFIPAGGRPNTINENNWKDYLTGPNHSASCKLIVEGANLFITPEARQKLFDTAGVVIVKDSSANKCGVICSSYEIIASMLLETHEFLETKDVLVSQVIEKLRTLARTEAQLLFREYKKNPSAALPPSSERISKAITRIHDQIIRQFDSVNKDDQQLLMSLVQSHIPPQIRNMAGNRIKSAIPLPYLKSVIACSLASNIVYREGLHFTEALPTENVVDIAISYLKQERKVESMVNHVLESDLEQKQEIADLLLRGGVRTGIDTPN